MGVVRSALVAAASLVAACAGDDAGELTCEDASLEISRTLHERWSDPHWCAADADCVESPPPEVQCPNGGRYGLCPLAIHAASGDAFTGALAATGDEVCPRAPACMASASCARAEIRCAGVGCRAVTDTACLERCEAMGCGGCGAVCLADPTCVTGADSCESIVSCSTSMLGRVIWAFPADEATGCPLPERVVVGVLDERIGGGTADFGCGVGPDGRSYYFASGSFVTAVGFPPCPVELPAGC